MLSLAQLKKQIGFLTLLAEASYEFVNTLAVQRPYSRTVGEGRRIKAATPVAVVVRRRLYGGGWLYELERGRVVPRFGAAVVDGGYNAVRSNLANSKRYVAAASGLDANAVADLE
jgi:hypothetical protein